MFDVQRAEQDDGVLECNLSARRVHVGNAFKVYEVHSDAIQECCNNCFDVYKLLMSNDIDRLPASWSICCGDENYIGVTLPEVESFRVQSL